MCVTKLLLAKLLLGESALACLLRSETANYSSKKSPQAELRKGIALCALGYYKDAKTSAQKYLRSAPDNADAQQLLIKASNKMAITRRERVMAALGDGNFDCPLEQTRNGMNDLDVSEKHWISHVLTRRVR